MVLSVLPVAGLGVETVRVEEKAMGRKSRLPGEFLPYHQVDVHARVAGYVERVEVDRGTVVKQGQLLVELSAPEMKAQLAEAEARVETLKGQRAEAEAKALAAQNTRDRLKMASVTPGAIAENELVLAEKAVDAARAVVESFRGSIGAAEAAIRAQQDLIAYLRVTAPFEGVITERMAHPGALTSPNAGPLLRLEQTSRLRLVVAVPESDAGTILRGANVAFTVPAYPGETFHGTVARLARSLDPKTRTMPVELDVANGKGMLGPGMYPEVTWPVHRVRPSLLVPPTAVVTTTERSFVIRVTDGKAEYVDVRRGAPAGALVEVYGGLKAGDEIVRRGSDEIREGSPVKVLPNK